MRNLSRRYFVPGVAASFVMRAAAPSDKLNIATVGIGGMGGVYTKNCESENIVAVCDVDDAYAAPAFKRYPKAKRYKDYRKMLDTEKGIDAVIIGTPDHTHAAVAMAAMKLGKAVYCAKPMTRTIHEARTLARTAREMKVATQMSVQSCASDAACTTAEWIQAGAVGTVREVHIWSDRPVWPQGLPRPEKSQRVPRSLDWDLWLGPAPVRPYHPAYHPFVWRGWCDFGTGALGDMACHAFHVPFRALNLGRPSSVSASTSFIVQSSLVKEGEGWTLKPTLAKFTETFPMSSVVTWDFPNGVRLIWYDGGIKPPRPAELAPGEQLRSAGAMYVGDKGVMLSGFTGGPHLIPESKASAWTPPPKTIERTAGHYEEWIAAAKGGKPANCNFDFGALLTETALLGVIAQRTGKHLVWDAEAARFTNEPDANQYVQEPYRAGWSL